MTQSLPERAEALRSLLPLLWCHLSLLPGSRTVQRYGDAEVEPSSPKPPWALADCTGLCIPCPYKRECRGEPWESMAKSMDRKYRLNTIAGALVKLDAKAHQLAHAVIAVYVEPYDPKTEPVRERDKDERQRWADAGVRWLAREIRGDIVGLGEVHRPLSDQIVELRQKGFSYRAIQRMLGCSSKTIAATVTSKGTLVEYSVR